MYLNRKRIKKWVNFILLICVCFVLSLSSPFFDCSVLILSYCYVSSPFSDCSVLISTVIDKIRKRSGSDRQKFQKLIEIWQREDREGKIDGLEIMRLMETHVLGTWCIETTQIDGATKWSTGVMFQHNKGSSCQFYRLRCVLSQTTNIIGHFW